MYIQATQIIELCLDLSPTYENDKVHGYPIAIVCTYIATYVATLDYYIVTLLIDNSCSIYIYVLQNVYVKHSLI